MKHLFYQAFFQSFYREKSDDQDKQDNITQIHQQPKAIIIAANRPDQSDRMCKRNDFGDRLDESGKIAGRKNHSGKKEHRRDKTGKIKIKVVYVFNKGCNEKGKSSEHQAS